MADRWADMEVLIRVGSGVDGMAVEIARRQFVVNVVNLIACTVVLIAGYCIRVLVLARDGSGVVWLILEAEKRPSA